MKDKYSTDYTAADVQDDPRLASSRKGGILIFISYLVFDIVLLAICYAMSAADTTTYIMGYPAWYTVGVIMCIGYGVFGIIWALRNKNISLAAKATDEEVKD